MQNPWLHIKQEIAKEVKRVTKFDALPYIEEPEIMGRGDLALPCFALAKHFQANPAEIAEDLAGKINVKYFKEIKNIGPYLNFYIDWSLFAKEVLSSVNKNYGKAKSRKVAVIDMSSPNPAHPFHMGTVRSTILGESLARTMKSQGINVKRFCYMNNLGKQASIMLYGYTKSKKKTPKGKADVWLGKIYFDTNKEMENNPDIEKKVSELLKRYERGDKEVTALAKKVFGICLKGFQENWKNLGIKFDDIVFESEFVKSGKDIAEELKKRGYSFESDGALILKLEPELPNTVLLRSDGTGLYLIRDLACTIWKEKKYKPDINVYVVAEDQKLHFAQQFKTLELLGHEKLAKISKHLGYSIVLLESKKMSARKGWMVLWDELLEEGIKKAEAEIVERYKKKDEKRAKDIALAAISYFILKYSPEKSVNFSWESALRFEGDTGPYLQYTCARAGSILKKAKIKPAKFDASWLSDPREAAIVKILAQYPSVLEKAARDLRPHYVATYLYTLAEHFNNFYQNCPVLTEKKEIKLARLKLVETVKTVMQSGLGVLGIKALEKM